MNTVVADNIYLYHLDAELQKLYIRDNGYNRKSISQHFSNVTRIAFLLCKKRLFVPLSNYLESSIAFSSLNEFAQICNNPLNPIVFLSTAPNLRDALKKKEKEHQENYYINSEFHYKTFEDAGLILPGSYQARHNSASKDIEKDLMISIQNENIWLPFKDFIKPTSSFEHLQHQLSDIPKNLSGQAYISDYILPHLDINSSLWNYADRYMNIIITRWYLKSFLSEFDAVCLKDIKYINADEILPELKNKNHLSYNHYVQKLQQTTLKQGLFKNKVNAFEYVSNCSVNELLEFKYSQEWASLYSTIPEKQQRLFFFGGKEMEYSDIKIGIVTALPEEAAAIEALLDNIKQKSFNNEKAAAGNRYVIGEIRANDGGIQRVALCLLPEMGNNFAAAVATKMQNHFPNIENIIVCGIAGGVPAKVRLGDVVVSTNGVIQYDYGKNEADKFTEKDSGTPCSLYLREAVAWLQKEELSKGDQWRKYIEQINSTLVADFSRPIDKQESYYEKCQDDNTYQLVHRDATTIPELHFDKIASGNVVQKDPRKRDSLHEESRIIAIEMESAGIKDATRLSNNGYIAIRGICDFCDGTKNDVWHYYAAAVAAAYTRALIASIPTS